MPHLVKKKGVTFRGDFLFVFGIQIGLSKGNSFNTAQHSPNKVSFPLKEMSVNHRILNKNKIAKTSYQKYLVLSGLE